MFSEHGIDWIGPATQRMEQLATPGVSPLLLGEYKLPLTPTEYVRRNVRVSPLPVAWESPKTTLLELPEVPVFSSDYPHFEGSSGPIERYRSELGDLPGEASASFLGGSIAECYARMGDPVAV